ncbi:RecT family recombinase [Mesorhizobium sp. M1B.F.Ca.ET.045.04.1.1]|uniref:RecT family recombinase n=1 Tax=Mesorhizobium sp. M1B.F.Ca.ET.045.04.1.1 TaxID=2493673 RepID=UPI0016741A66|nr:RecT family recombinase [Mesorhizobium sp. M1B.F.Ca.ET.045.04.1.1]
MNAQNDNQLSPYDITRQKVIAGGTIKSLNSILGAGRGREYAISVLDQVRRSIGGKNDLTKCNPESIVACMRSAAALRLSIDHRQHVHIINYGGVATLQIGYRGYLARLQESLPGFAAQVECVYKGEPVTVKRDGFLETVVHERKDCFGNRSDTDIIGVYAQISYDAGTARVSHVITMNRAEVDKVRGCAKDSSFWNKWYTEKAKVACLRRACKMHFAAVTHDLDAADNDNYDGSAAREEGNAKADSINERLSGDMKVVSHEDA